MKGIHPVLSQSAMVLVAAVLTVGLASGISTGLRLTGAAAPGGLDVTDMSIKVTTSSGIGQPASARSISSPANQEVRIEDDDDDDDKKECILFLNPCPPTNPRCGMDIVTMEIACGDSRCTPESCVKKEELAKISSSRQSSTPTVGPNSCILQTFECAPGALPSCFKRVRSMQLDCTDRRCSTSTCISASVFFARQKLEPWDLGVVEGPFPRKETMCVVQRTACPPNDPSCVSPVSLEQIDCKECSGDMCTRLDILVDERDNILGNVSPSQTTGETGTNQSGETQNTARSSAQSQATARTTVQQTAPLGCFTESGIWTTDRSACADDQNKFLQSTTTVPTLTITPPDEEIRREIDRQLVPDTARSSLIQTLLASIFDASERLNSMLFLPIPDDLRGSIVDTIEWLRNIQRDAQDPNKTMSDLQNLAGSVHTQLSDIQTAVGDWSRNQPVPTRDPNSLTDKLDAIFGDIATAFSMVQEELLMLPSSVLSDFAQAQSAYEGLKPACLANTNLCGQLSSVVDLLESSVNGLRIMLEEEGRQDLIDRMDAMF